MNLGVFGWRREGKGRIIKLTAVWLATLFGKSAQRPILSGFITLQTYLWTRCSRVTPIHTIQILNPAGKMNNIFTFFNSVHVG